MPLSVWNTLCPLTPTLLKTLSGWQIPIYLSRLKKYFWHKDKHGKIWNRIKSPEINPYIYGKVILNKVLRQFKGERIEFSTNDAQMTGYPHVEN